MGYKFGLIGHPISHSLSPWMQTKFIELAQVNGEYKLYQGSPDELENVIKHLREMEIDGFNVTVPYKQVIIDYLDELDADAAKLGAVNTVVLRDGKWVGYSTDGEGYVQSVKEKYPNLLKRDISVLLLGAGGAARGIYRSLVQQNITHIDIANRSLNNAESLLSLKESDTLTSVLSFKEAEENLSTYDLIIQTTSVGMKPNVQDQVIQLNNIKENAVVSDIVYQPIETKILKEAQNNGAYVHYGHSMLIYQGQKAFEKWTGINLEVNHLTDELEQKLRGE
ncbi:shikimate dehydrogenase [Gracilibacillus marinus]|uniref:Shikimate dehydrogenase (NADP(+)) n=1 Tax=Gracilibacillus marinus TaxID=630535 RepID=A0ABV8VXK6_9BACI